MGKIRIYSLVVGAPDVHLHVHNVFESGVPLKALGCYQWLSAHSQLFGAVFLREDNKTVHLKNL